MSAENNSVRETPFGRVPKRWLVKPLSTCAEIQTGVAKGRRLKSAEAVSVPYLRVANVQDGFLDLSEIKCIDIRVSEVARYSLLPGDVLLTEGGDFDKVGRGFIWNAEIPNCVHQNHIFVVRPHKDILLPEFLAYQTKSPYGKGYFLSVAHKTTNLASINTTKLKAFPTIIPPMEEQCRIVAQIKEMLERVKVLRELRTASLTELVLLETAVFADFIKVDRKDSLPVVQLKSILSCVQYGTSQKASSNGAGVPLLRMGNIQNGSLDTGDLKHIELPEKELKKYRLNEGDILFNRTNSLELVGKAATFHNLPGDWVFASYLVRLVVDRKKALPEYVTAVVNSRIGRDFITQNANRAIGMVNINAKIIQELALPLPSLEVQQELIDRLQTARKVTMQLHAEMDGEEMDSLSPAILRKAFAGEL